MSVQVFGCSHHNTSIEIRERLAFTAEQAGSALDSLRGEFPKVETVLLSTCNRVELYTANENGTSPTSRQVAQFLARSRGVEPAVIVDHLIEHEGWEAVRHLFLVASSLDSMVVGEPQILAQVKQAYDLATRRNAAGPVTHAAFQAAVKVARRVVNETTIHQRRLSIPSVAVADFARQIFERFDDKNTLVIGAGEMAEETLRYLQKEGAARVTVVNRSFPRAAELARQWNGCPLPWERLHDAIVRADLVISTTGASEPIVTLSHFTKIEQARGPRPLFILDLAVPRDFEPAVGTRPEVYLYSIDDLREACQRNRDQRDKELPKALRIIEQEAHLFVADLHHRAVGPVIKRLREDWGRLQEEELRRLFNKLPHLQPEARREIEEAFGRFVNKILHPPMESLRVESRHGIPRALLDAMARLFQIKD